MTRVIRNDDVWSAMRGLQMWSRSADSLARLRECHEGKEEFASRVIVVAVDATIEMQKIVKGAAQ